MEISVSEHTGKVPVTVLQVQGEVTADTYEQLQQRAEDAVKAGAQHVVMDLGGVTYMSSSGLRAIHHVFTLLNRAGAPGGDQEIHQGVTAGTYKSPYLKLANPRRDVAQTLKTAGFDMFLGIYPGVRQAVDSFGEADAGRSA